MSVVFYLYNILQLVIDCFNQVLSEQNLVSNTHQ